MFLDEIIKLNQQKNVGMHIIILFFLDFKLKLLNYLDEQL